MKMKTQNTWRQLFGLGSAAPLALQLRQIELVRKVMWLFIPLLIVFAWYNLNRNHMQLAVVELSMVVLLLLSVTWVCKTAAHCLPWIAALVTFVLGCMVFMDGGIGQMGLLWMMMVPFFFFAVLGQRWGWVLSLLYLLQIILIQTLDTSALPYSSTQICVFIVAYSMQALLAAAATLLRSNHHQLTLHEQHQCQQIQCIQAQVDQEAAVWRATMDCMDDAMIIVDEQGEVRKKNRAAEQLSVDYPGMEVEKLCQQWLSSYPEQQRAGTRQHLEQEVFIPSIQKWFKVSLYPLHEVLHEDLAAPLDVPLAAEDVADGVLLMLQDVSEQHATQALAKQELYFLHHMQQVNQIIAQAKDTSSLMQQLMEEIRDIYQADRVCLWTADAPDLAHYRVEAQANSEKCVALPCQVLVDQDVEMQQMFEAALATKTTMIVLPQVFRQQHAVLSQMVVSIRNQQHQPWLLVVQQCEQDVEWSADQRNLVHMIADRLVDVVDAWQSKQSLERRTDQYLQLVENMPDGIMILKDEHIIFANEVMCHLLGEETTDDCIGVCLQDFIHPDFKAVSKQRFDLALQGKRNPIQEMKMVDKQGNLIDVVSSSMSISYHGKAAVQIILRDVTKRNQMDKA
ncbi:MAG: PAS domain S-box protein, partial [Mariprofundaceae bacterium]|nr:PAS domain S-box protein [Mariprofundaceae bacterium]